MISWNEVERLKRVIDPRRHLAEFSAEQLLDGGGRVRRWMCGFRQLDCELVESGNHERLLSVFVWCWRTRSKPHSSECACVMLVAPRCPFAKLPMSPVDSQPSGNGAAAARKSISRRFRSTRLKGPAQGRTQPSFELTFRFAVCTFHLGSVRHSRRRRYPQN